MPLFGLYFSVIELETRKEVQKDVVLLAAEEIYKHAYKSVVRLIARQRIDDQSILMLQCLRRDQIVARLAELDKLGYSVGPDTSREFCLTDGQKLLVKCRGNIGMTTRSNKNVIFTSICPIFSVVIQVFLTYSCKIIFVLGNE